MVTNIYQNRYEYLRDIIARHGGQAAVAEKLGVTRQYMNLVGSDKQKKNIGNAMARKIETVFGLPIGTIDSPMESKVAQMTDTTITVPMLNVVASMGHGARMDHEEETVQNITFSKRWLRTNITASSYERLAVVTAKGDSMADTFLDGSILLVDTGITQLKIDGVYVLLREDELFIKRIQRNIDGSYDIISDNPMYKTQRVENPLKSGLLVLGRVLMAMNMHKM